MSSVIVQSGNARLPVVYESARYALAQCEQIDECKEWADRAAALASYAKQAEDDELMNHARRIQVRAVRRMGELLEAIEPQPGARTDKPTVGDHSRLKAARDAGLSEHQQVQAVRVARVEENEFDRQVESETPPTVTALAEQGKQAKPHVVNNSGENEWYTPDEYLQAARAVMGGIDLDPASSAAAQKRVRAKTFYTKDDDGLQKSWNGSVWMNPPYAQPLIAQFCAKLLSELPHVEHACVLINNATETRWLQPMLSRADAVCFPIGRVRFIDPDGNPGGAPLQGQVVVYFGANGDVFHDQFSKLGVVLMKYAPRHS